ncbi:thioredoxin domain-containing protein [Candidatus Carsonella ruddii]|uniref:Putative thioredoxin n=1 Tax=Candidatus Carsonella ruddii CE isolate Thao2000 TaxID=1202536 RepID=J7GZT8_CARRU|nr:thioredoxin domain-containing protein [Candidatus Carsonella ruddii]AFP83515.1 putative thioredoxin [Candidatus Carsonella ruddii CE isolate Thao2000]
MIKYHKNLLKLNIKIFFFFFSSKWCKPCILFKKNIKIIEKKCNLIFINIDIDIFQDIAIKFKIIQIPTLIKFKNIIEIYKKKINLKKIIFFLKK